MMSTQNRSYSTVALWLLPILILLSVGKSGNNEAYKSPDCKVPMNWQHYEKNDHNEGWNQLSPKLPEIPDIKILFKQLDDLERKDNKHTNPGNLLYPGNTQTSTYAQSLPVGPETHIRSPNNYHEFPGPLDMELMNAAGVGEFEHVMSFEQADDWDRKPSEGQSHMLAKVLRKKAERRPSGPPTTKAGCTSKTTPSFTKPTAVIRPSTHCLEQSTPYRPATTKCPNSPTPKTIPTTRKPPPPSTTTIPTTKKVPSGPQCRKKSKQLTAKTAKMILEIILSTKQHVLSVLKTLNYLEMEVLSRSPVDCPLQHFGGGQSQPKRKPDKQKVKPLKPSMPTHTQAFFFGIRPASQMESDTDMALAREEELKLKSRVWEEHQQEMRHMPQIKSRNFQIAPQAAVRLEPKQEPPGPQKPLDHKNPLNHYHFDFGAT